MDKEQEFAARNDLFDNRPAMQIAIDAEQFSHDVDQRVAQLSHHTLFADQRPRILNR